MELGYLAACGCHTGRLRSNNEDNFLFAGKYLPPDHKGLPKPLKHRGSLAQNPLFAVFDGMGGAEFGELASFLAAKTMADLASESEPGKVLDFFINCCRKMNAVIWEETLRRGCGHMGSTVCALILSGDKACVMNVGDSRVYIYRAGALHQLSVDHLERLPETLSRKPRLTQNLGISPEELSIEPSLCTAGLCPGDVLLLCSDGLTDMLDDARIKALLSTARRPADMVKKLIAGALDAGGRDNISVVAIKIK